MLMVQYTAQTPSPFSNDETLESTSGFRKATYHLFQPIDRSIGTFIRTFKPVNLVRPFVI